MSSSPAPLTWLQAAEHVLREEGPEMHIKDLTSRILELGIVKSNCATSLETLLYRQTSGSIQGKGVNARIVAGPTKFMRVQGKHGWFGLKPNVLLEESEFHGIGNMSIDSADIPMLDNNSESEPEMEIDHKEAYPSQQQLPAVQSQTQQQLKKKTSPHSSDDESHNLFFLMSSDEDSSEDEEEEEEEELDESLEAGLSEDEDAENSEQSETMYRRRYWFLKRLAKRIIFENFALANQLLVTEEQIKKAEMERRFLFKKLLMFERSGVAKKGVAGLLPSSVLKSRSRPSMAHTVSQPTDTPTSNQRLAVGYVGPYPGGGVTEEVTSSNGTKRTSGHLSKYGSRLKRQKGPEVGSRSSGVDREIGEDGSHSRNKKTKNWGEGKKEESVAEKGNPRVSGILNSSKDQNKLLMSDSSENSEGEWNEDSDDGNGKLFVSSSNLKHRRKPGRGRGESGKKRGGHNDAAAKAKQEEEIDGDGAEDGELELAMRSGKVRRLHPIPLNKDGTPVFPIVIGGLKVSNLGKIVCDRVAYHSERYLLPVGFESTRMYPSMIDPTRRCLYTCRILDGGDTPMFEMVADDDPDNPIRATSSTACQSIVLKNINKARDKQATNSGSGPEFFGYSNPTVLNLLQKMPDAKKCPKYKFVRFAEPSRRGGRKVVSNSNSEIKKVSGSSTKSKGIVSKVKKGMSSKKSVAPKSAYSNSLTKGSRSNSNSIAIAPILGSRDSQVGYRGLGSIDEDSLDSSSSELTSATDNELVIDS